MIKIPIPLAVLVALPVSLPGCAPVAQTAAYGENVSFYFNSGAACPEHVPAWRPFDADLVNSPAGARNPGDASDAFGKALANLGNQTPLSNRHAP